MDINVNKSEQRMNQLYSEESIGQQGHYREVLGKLDGEYRYLSHGRANFIAKINGMFYRRTKGNNVDYLVMKQIDNIRSRIASEGVTYQVVRTENQKASKTKQHYLTELKKV